MNDPDTRFHENSAPWKLTGTAVLIVLLGLAARIYTYRAIPLINIDGVLYIQQAQALYYGLWDSVIACYEYLPNYPFFIAGAYGILGDWVLAGQAVSIFFGTLVQIPVYWMLRRFFDEQTSNLTLLIFALLPPFVFLSRDVMRDPTYWFFAMTGLYLFVLQLEEKKTLYGFLASLCMMMGAWARIEGMLYIFTAIICLTFFRLERKWRHLFSFLLPFLGLLCIGVIYIYTAHIDPLELLKPERLISRPAEFFGKYREIRQNLKLLADQNLPEFSPYFFPRVRNLIWLIALGTLVSQIVEALFYVFPIPLIWGFAKARPYIRTDRRLIYFTLTAALSLVVLYSQIIYNWAMTSRFTALFLFPCLIFTGFGVQHFMNALKQGCRMKEQTCIILACILIIGISLPKTLMAVYVKDKMVFRDIGQFIEKKEKNRRVVSVAGSFWRVRFVHFYANVNTRSAACFDGRAVLADDWWKDIRILKQFDYFVLDEANCPPGALARITSGDSGLIRCGEWNTRQLGRMILYEVRH